MAEINAHSDFLIVGAGPVGLMLALALRDAGLDVMVVEQIPSRSHRSPFSKALSLNAGTLETFRSFGLDGEVVGIGKPLPQVDFGLVSTLIQFSPEILGLKHSHNLVLSQKRTEDVLLRLCKEMGVSFRWGLKFESLEQNDNHVIATFTRDAEADDALATAGNSKVRVQCDWLIGCDGTHSAVRESAGIGFPGNAASAFAWTTDVRFGEIGPPFAFKRGPNGPVLLFCLDDNSYRVIGFFQGENRPEVPSMNQIASSLREAFGTNFGLHEVLWASVVGNASRVAETFRKGRVFLAGDAAHQHFPAGGQGVNMGIQDAVNLAWKLITVHRRTVMPGPVAERVLDTYSTERKHASHSTIRYVNAQSSLIFSTAPNELALGEVMAECLRHPDLNEDMALKLTGFDRDISTAFRHGPSEKTDDLLLGSRMTHLCPLVYEEDKFTSKVLENRLTLVLLESQESLRKVAESWSPKVHVLDNLALAVGKKWDGVSAFLLRPDLHICWICRQRTSMVDWETSLRQTLTWWLEDAAAPDARGLTDTSQ